MSKILPIIILILFLNVFYCVQTKADYSTTYQSYITLTDLYRDSYQSYISAKNKYLTYNTLTAQKEALENGRSFLKVRDQLVGQYLKLLRDKTLETGGFSEAESNLIVNKLNVESVWLVDHRTKYDTVSTLVDLQRTSDQTQDRYGSIIRYVALQTAGSILANKELILTNSLDDILIRIGDVVKDMQTAGVDITLTQRWLLEASNKVELAKEKQNEASDIFTNLRGQNVVVDYNRGTFALTESNQYLKEASSYVNEILRIIKGE